MNKKNMRVDTNAIDRMMKAQDTKERIRAKLEKKRQEANFTLEQTNDPKNLVAGPLSLQRFIIILLCRWTIYSSALFFEY